MLLDSPTCPLTPNEVYDSGYWRERAQMTRDMATDTAQTERATLLKEADAYDRLARYADGILASMIDLKAHLS
ncbi:MAG: hypothetical protein AB1586_07575 [Pseudomonadota bacterium]